MFLTVVSITQPFAFVLKKTDISTRRKKSVLQILNRFPNDFTAFCGKVARFFHIFLKIIPIFHRILSVFPVFCRKSKLSTSFSTICGKKMQANTLFFEFSTVFNYPDIENIPRYRHFPIFQPVVENTVEIFFLCCRCIISVSSVHTTNTQKNREVKTGCTLENGCLLYWQLPV